jgi:hypothetical protein
VLRKVKRDALRRLAARQTLHRKRLRPEVVLCEDWHGAATEHKSNYSIEVSSAHLPGSGPRELFGSES